MSNTNVKETTTVRRQGSVEVVFTEENDHGFAGTQWGTRRSRQIAKRHWVCKVTSVWNSNSGGGTKVTMKIPNSKKEEKLKGGGNYNPKMHW